MKCARKGCLLDASALQCPTCLKMGIDPEESHFCSQECFKGAWPVHKLLHVARDAADAYNPWPYYKYTGSLRPYPYGPKRAIPKGFKSVSSDGSSVLIQRPDYADTGVPKSEMLARNLTAIPTFLSREEQDGIRTVCRVSLLVLH